MLIRVLKTASAVIDEFGGTREFAKLVSQPGRVRLDSHACNYRNPKKGLPCNTFVVVTEALRQRKCRATLSVWPDMQKAKATRRSS